MSEQATVKSQGLRDRARQARHLVYLAKAALPALRHVIDERSLVVLPLVLSSLDMADTVCFLLEAAPEQHWVAAVALQRAQIEHLLRAAFFARAATPEEVDRFRIKGELPEREGRTIYLREITAEAYHDLEDLEKLLEMVKNHGRDLSGFLHGGQEILTIYSRMHDEMGNIELELDELQGTVDNVAVSCSWRWALQRPARRWKPRKSTPLSANLTNKVWRSCMRAAASHPVNLRAHNVALRASTTNTQQTNAAARARYVRRTDKGWAGPPVPRRAPRGRAAGARKTSWPPPPGMVEGPPPVGRAASSLRPSDSR